MGIISLQTFLNKSLNKRKMHISKLKNKKICIDIYNYIYKYLAKGKLILQLEKMCKILRRNNIQCLFVFDGKYGKIKVNTQKDRQKKREKAERKFQKLNLKDNLSKNEKRVLKKVLRERVKVTKWDIHDTKKCLEHCGMKYVVADGEAEEYCAELVNKNYVYGCMSDDTDLFPFGCKYILRNFNINKETVEIYYFPEVIESMEISFSDFKTVCCLSSNDYNTTNKNKNFIYYYKLYKNYILDKVNYNNTSFINWLRYEELINNTEFEKYNCTKEVYNLENKNIFKNTKYIVIRNGRFDQKAVNILAIDRENYLSELYN